MSSLRLLFLYRWEKAERTTGLLRRRHNALMLRPSDGQHSAEVARDRQKPRQAVFSDQIGEAEAYQGPDRKADEIKSESFRHDRFPLLHAYARNPGKAAHSPNVFAKYSAITFTSASDACAPRATILWTIEFQSVAFIRWLVTTSIE